MCALLPAWESQLCRNCLRAIYGRNSNANGQSSGYKRNKSTASTLKRQSPQKRTSYPQSPGIPAPTKPCSQKPPQEPPQKQRNVFVSGWRSPLKSKSLGKDSSVIVLRDSESNRRQARAPTVNAPNTAIPKDKSPDQTEGNTTLLEPDSPHDVRGLLSRVLKQVQDPNLAEFMQSISDLIMNRTSSYPTKSIPASVYEQLIDNMIEAYTTKQLKQCIDFWQSHGNERAKLRSIQLKSTPAEEADNPLLSLSFWKTLKDPALDPSRPKRSYRKGTFANSILNRIWAIENQDDANEPGVLVLNKKVGRMKWAPLAAGGIWSHLNQIMAVHRVHLEFFEKEKTVKIYGSREACYSAELDIKERLKHVHEINVNLAEKRFALPNQQEIFKKLVGHGLLDAISRTFPAAVTHTPTHLRYEVRSLRKDDAKFMERLLHTVMEEGRILEKESLHLAAQEYPGKFAFWKSTRTPARISHRLLESKLRRIGLPSDLNGQYVNQNLHEAPEAIFGFSDLRTFIRRLSLSEYIGPIAKLSVGTEGNHKDEQTRAQWMPLSKRHLRAEIGQILHSSGGRPALISMDQLPMHLLAAWKPEKVQETASQLTEEIKTRHSIAASADHAQPDKRVAASSGDLKNPYCFACGHTNGLIPFLSEQLSHVRPEIRNLLRARLIPVPGGNKIQNAPRSLEVTMNLNRAPQIVSVSSVPSVADTATVNVMLPRLPVDVRISSSRYAQLRNFDRVAAVRDFEKELGRIASEHHHGNAPRLSLEFVSKGRKETRGKESSADLPTAAEYMPLLFEKVQETRFPWHGYDLVVSRVSNVGIGSPYQTVSLETSSTSLETQLKLKKAELKHDEDAKQSRKAAQDGQEKELREFLDATADFIQKLTLASRNSQWTNVNHESSRADAISIEEPELAAEAVAL